MKTIGRNEFIRKMNELVRSYDGYSDGMIVLNFPYGAESPLGYTFDANNSADKARLSSLASKARKEIGDNYIFDTLIDQKI